LKRAAALCLILIGLCLGRPARANDTVYYYYNDAQGSPVAVTDASGNVIERTQYAPYGQVLNRPEHDGPGYTKHEEDAATGLTNMQQRYDDKAIGRMLSMDPVDVDPTTGANFNRYAYAEDNPYRYVDPDGRCTGSHISNSDGTCASTGDFTTQGTNPSLVGASAAERGAILGIQEPSQNARNQQVASKSSPKASDSSESSGSDSVIGGDGIYNANGGTLIPAAYQGNYHDQLVNDLASGMRSEGANVLTEVNTCLGAICARIDILGRSPVGDLFGLEVKTGLRPSFTPQQLAVYPHLRAGNILVSPDSKILQIGLIPGSPLPSIPTILLYQRDASSPPFTVPIQ
jgi:RHS repeat-associated protein